MFSFDGIKSKITVLTTILKSNKNVIDKSVLKATGFVNESFIAKFKSVRRLLLIVILWFNYRIWMTSDMMYRTTGKMDAQWTIYACAFISLLTIFASFYTNSRTKEIDSFNKKAVATLDFIDKNNDGIDDREEGITDSDTKKVTEDENDGACPKAVDDEEEGKETD